MLRTLPVASVGVVSLCAMLVGQKNSVQPQPQADKLAPITVPTRGSGGRGPVQKPEGVMPTVPAGFTISTYAEMPSPRMMTYAPNGDLFVSSPQGNNIRVFRDANNDGTFEAQGVYAQGGAPAGRGGGGGGGGGGRGAGGPAAQPDLAELATKVNAAPGVNLAINGQIFGVSAPACAPPPAFQPGPGALGQPFGLAFNNGYLYVGNTASIVRYKYTNGDMQSQGEPEKIADLPGGGGHTTRISFSTAREPRCMSLSVPHRTIAQVKTAVVPQFSNSIPTELECVFTVLVFGIPLGWRCSRVRISSGQPSTNATNSATTWYRTMRHP